MRVILAPDSYKDALSAREATAAMAAGIRRALPDVELDECPMGDGGEGTLDALLAATGAEPLALRVHDALDRPCQATWGWAPETHTAYIELAQACGLQQLTMAERTATRSSTHGVGELIRAALDRGARHLLLMLGGSATNDAGAGMLQALGARLLDARGRLLPPGGMALTHLAHLELDDLDSRLAGVTIETAVDVNNPLLGPDGASAVFGPQKGATPEDVMRLDAALGHFADVTAQALGEDHRETAGTGAAGGIGFAARAFLGAQLRPGIELVMSQVGLSERLSGTSLVITGEGRLDGQSLAGKTPIGIARCASKQGVPVIVLAGCLGDGWQAAYREGVTAAFALADGPMELNDSLSRCTDLLADRAESLIRLYRQASTLNPSLPY